MAIPDKLRIDFAPRSPRPAWMALLLLGVGIGFAAYSARCYLDAQAQQAALESRIAAAATSGHVAAAGGSESSYAREVLGRVAVPWHELFAALGRTQTDTTSLLSMEPDGVTRALKLTGEAKDFAALLAYVGALEREPFFQRIELLRHETVRHAGYGAVSFELALEWVNRS